MLLCADPGDTSVGSKIHARLFTGAQMIPLPYGRRGNRTGREVKALRKEVVLNMLRWFETRLDPYPKDDPVEPPKGLLAFCLHYSHGAKRWLALMAIAAAAASLA